jgi:hypothetical protein
MTVTQLAPDEALSPELVLVLTPELRAQALARLGPPAWARPPLRPAAVAPVASEPYARSVGAVLATRVAMLGLIFVAATALTLAMSLVAQAVR